MSARPAPRLPGSTKRPSPLQPLGIIVLCLLFVGLTMSVNYLTGTGRLIKFNEFLDLVDKQVLKSVVFVGTDYLYGEVKDANAPGVAELKLWSTRFCVRLPPTRDSGPLATEIRTKNPGVEVDFQRDNSDFWSGLIQFVLLLLFMLALLYFWTRARDPMGGSMLNNFIKSPARRYEKGKTRIAFDDVADMENAKQELLEVVEFLKAPEKFQRLGAVVPKGVLLVGPPGTGKTLLARAVAGEAGVPFYSISGSEFIQMFVGVGASRVRDMFKTAKENAPCLLFIDEIDAVGRMRGTGLGGGSDEREQTLNQILVEMDGFQPNETIVVLASTNRPDVLDTALLRPGRFDRHITIDRPTAQGRLAILKVHTKNKPLADNVDLDYLAKQLTGMTGADLKNLANEAALLATRLNKSRIEQSDFEAAVDRVLRGPKREAILSIEGKRRTAYHEAGHALMSWLVPDLEKPLKVSIIPRGQSLGVTFNAPDEDRYHHGKDYFKSRLVMLMGGRAADRLIFGQAEAGAEMDLKQATKLARYMVTHWGMSERVGPMSFRVGEEHVFLGKELAESRDFSEGTARIIDEEVQKLLVEADERALELLRTHRDELEKFAEALVQREEMDRAQIDALLRPAAG